MMINTEKLNSFIIEIENILSDLDDYDIFTTNVSSGKSVSDVKSNKNYVLIMGNEGNGVRKHIASFANKTIYIPINNSCESLNVAIATSIILYEWHSKK